MRLQHQDDLEAHAQDAAALKHKLQDACAKVEELKVDIAAQVLALHSMLQQDHPALPALPHTACIGLLLTGITMGILPLQHTSGPVHITSFVFAEGVSARKARKRVGTGPQQT
jgi:hypothetical protein